MPFRFELRQHLMAGRAIGRALFLAAPVAVVTGSACALFLGALERATQLRWENPWLLFLLPLSGVMVAWIYEVFGSNAASGNNLLIDALYEAENEPESLTNPNALETRVPLRMAPLILLTTVLTHLCGGSAGREGTAVQMGGALAAAWARLLRLSRSDFRVVLMCGIAAGFGGVFGTPLAGAVFALEVISTGKFRSDALIACLFAALLGDFVAQSWGAHHVLYHVAAVKALGAFDAILALKIAFCALFFGLTATLFAEVTHETGDFFKARLKFPLARPFVGGLIIIALTFLLGTRDYLGLGVSSPDSGAVTIVSAFHAGGASPFSWWWKLVFTAITLGSGFKGGEVTPLFFLGATLGNLLALWLHAPVDVLAAMGFLGVFAGATNTPLACTLMGIELFGTGIAPYAAISCFLSYAWSGHTGIYLSQRLRVSKSGGPANASTLREARQNRARDRGNSS